MNVAAEFRLESNLAGLHMNCVAVWKDPAVVAGSAQSGIPAESTPVTPVRQPQHPVGHPCRREEHFILKEPDPLFSMQRRRSVADQIVFQMPQPDLMYIASFFKNANGILNEIWIAKVKIVVLGMENVIRSNRFVGLVY